MTPCDDHRDQILLLRAGALDDDGARAELLAHIERGCPQCTRHLFEADEVLGELLIGTGRADPPPSIKHRLMAKIQVGDVAPVGRIDAQPKDDSAASPAQPRLRMATWLHRIVPIAAAAAIAAAATFVIMSRETREHERHVAELTLLVDSLQEEVDRGTEQPGGARLALDTLDRFVNDLRSLLRSSTLQIASLTGDESIADASVRMLWDRELGQCVLIASSGLRALTDPQWNLILFDEHNTPIEAGTVTFDERGFSSLRLTLPEGIDPMQFAHAGLRRDRADDDASPGNPLMLRGPLIH